jgi:hypothetical protein
MLQTLDAIGCTEFATLSTGFGVVNYNQRSGWEHHRLSALAWQLKKVLTAYAEHRQAAVA